MAEYLIYKKSHWMDDLTASQVDELPSHKLKQYQARYVAGDIVEVQENGYWRGIRQSRKRL